MLKNTGAAINTNHVMSTRRDFEPVIQTYSIEGGIEHQQHQRQHATAGEDPTGSPLESHRHTHYRNSDEEEGEAEQHIPHVLERDEYPVRIVLRPWGQAFGLHRGARPAG